MIESAIFWVFAVLAVGSAIAVVTHRSIIYVALFLIVAFLSNAAFYILNNADFLAIAQVLVYAVGLTIILLFAIMFTGEYPKLSADKKPPLITRVASILVVLYLAGVLLSVTSYPFKLTTLDANTEYFYALIKEGTAGRLGLLMFNQYSLPFELASVLLLGAMIGAILLAKKQFEPDDESADAFKYRLSRASAPTAGAVSDIQHALFSQPAEADASEKKEPVSPL